MKKSKILKDAITKSAQLIALFMLSTSVSMATAVYTYTGNNYKAVYGMALGVATTWFFLITLNLIGRWIWKGKEKKQN